MPHARGSLCGAFTDQLAPDYTAGNQLGTLPRKRGTIRVDTGGHPDVCAIATRRINLDDSFCRSMRSDLEDWCARVTVAVTPRGRAYVDRLHRALELLGADDQISSLPADWARTPVELLQGAVEAKVVALDGPDAIVERAASRDQRCLLGREQHRSGAGSRLDERSHAVPWSTVRVLGDVPGFRSGSHCSSWRVDGGVFPDLPLATAR